MKYHTFFFRKLGKMSQNLLSAVVVIGALSVDKICLSESMAIMLITSLIELLPMSIYNFS